MIGSTPEIYQFAPAKGPSQKEDLLPTMIFQGLLLLIFRGVPCEKYVKIWRHRKYVSRRGCFFKLFILFSSWTCVFLSIKQAQIKDSGPHSEKNKLCFGTSEANRFIDILLRLNDEESMIESTLPETNSSFQKIGHPKRKHPRIPTIHFQG